MVNNTDILLGMAIVGLIIISIMSVNALVNISSAGLQTVQPLRITPEQYFGGG